VAELSIVIAPVAQHPAELFEVPGVLTFRPLPDCLIDVGLVTL
jgi:hypothetical protein